MQCGLFADEPASNKSRSAGGRWTRWVSGCMWSRPQAESVASQFAGDKCGETLHGQSALRFCGKRRCAKRGGAQVFQARWVPGVFGRGRRPGAYSSNMLAASVPCCIAKFSQCTGHGSFFPIGKNRHLPISGQPGIAVEERCSATKCRSESL